MPPGFPGKGRPGGPSRTYADSGRRAPPSGERGCRLRPADDQVQGRARRPSACMVIVFSHDPRSRGAITGGWVCSFPHSHKGRGIHPAGTAILSRQPCVPHSPRPA